MLGNLSCNSLTIIIVNFATQVKRKRKINSNFNCCGIFLYLGQGSWGGGGAKIRLPTTCLGQQNCETIVRRIMTSCYHGSKISGSQQPFLIETAICTVERWKESMGYRFGTGCNHAQENHTCQFLLFFSCHIC